MHESNGEAKKDEELEQFRRLWQPRPGIGNWLAVVNNQPLGKRFMLTSCVFFLLGGVMALLIRLQLAVPENEFLGPELFNQLFTMHGSTMMYLFSVPFLEGLALYLLPMMLGSRDVAFPRLTAFSYWVYLFGGLLFYFSFFVGSVPDVGWFGYAPLSTSRFSGMGTDFWLLGLSMVEIAGITAGIEIVATILKLRAPGMSINRMPLFAWAMLVTGVMILFAFTTLWIATVMLEMDRSLGTNFFVVAGGGSSLLWQHLFWFFGHPEVYIMFIPATGIVSMIVAAFARREIAAYTLVAVAIVLTGFVSFGLWVHHMFATGLPELSKTFFTAASLMIAIASGIQVFAWIATLWGTRPAFKVPLLYVLGFFFIFVLGGMTGVMIAIVPFDLQVHDTYFIVAHFHYVIIGGVIFPILAGLHYWLPKITGRLLGERLGLWSFWLIFTGFNLTFFPMHIMGFLGMPRRVYTYPSGLQLGGYNLVATASAFLLALGFLLFVWNFLLCLRKGESAGDNPWGSDSLEWSLASPPESYSFYAPPIVHSRTPLWDENGRDDSKHGRLSNEQAERASKALAGAPLTWRATLSTDSLHAQPQAIQNLSGPSHLPLVTALGVLVTAVAVLLKLGLLAGAGAVFTFGAIVYWLWPNNKTLEMMHESDLVGESGLPIFTSDSRSVGWWGAVGYLTIFSTIFGALFYSYFYIRLYSEVWPQGNIERPELLLAAVAFSSLLLSAAPHYLAGRGFWEAQKTQVRIGLGGSILLGLGFLVMQFMELGGLRFAPQTNAYGSLFFVIHWLLSTCVVIGLALTIAAQFRLGREPDEQHGFMALQMQVTSMFWYFTVIIGVLVFGVLYVSPYLI